MTVPEENRPKTQKAEDVLSGAQDTTREPQGASGRTMREALEEADVSPEDFTEK